MKIEEKKILVTGITGTLGERVAKRFVREGAHVFGLIRKKERITKIQDMEVTPILGNLNDTSLTDHLSGIDIVIHCAAYLGNDEDEAIKSNVTGVENLARHSLEAGVEKFFYISTLTVYGEPTHGLFEETSSIVSHHDEIYIDTKAKSEHILSTYVQKGLDVITLRPGVICAEENSYWGDRQIERMLKTDVVDWVHPEDMVAWVHTDNLVEMIRLVLIHGTSNEVYNAIDGNFPEIDFRVIWVKSLKKELKIPNRDIQRPIYSNTKIKEVGYQPIHTFDQTVSNLEALGLHGSGFIT